MLLHIYLTLAQKRMCIKLFHYSLLWKCIICCSYMQFCFSSSPSHAIYSNFNASRSMCLLIRILLTSFCLSISPVKQLLSNGSKVEIAKFKYVGTPSISQQNWYITKYHMTSKISKRNATLWKSNYQLQVSSMLRRTWCQLFWSSTML